MKSNDAPDIDEQLDHALALLEAQLTSCSPSAETKTPPFFAVAALLALKENDFDLAAAVFETNEGRSGACSIPTLNGDYVVEGTLASRHPDHQEESMRALCALELTLIVGEGRSMEGDPISHFQEDKVCGSEDVGEHLRLLFEEGFVLRRLRDQVLRS